MSTNIGPLLTDAKFFGELLDTTQPGLEGIPAAAAAGDYARCRKMFGDYVRASLQPEVFFTTLPDGMKPEWTEKLADGAEKACRHYMVSCGTPSDFKGAPVDWFSNPTYNNYCEWPWQLSRHAELQTLAKAYRATGNEEYAEACAELFDSWVKQAVAPTPPCSGYATLCWRTIECGIRQGLVWPEILHSFYKSPAFTDDILTDWYKSVWEHGERLTRDLTMGNWLIMEMNGLGHIGILYPCFKLAGEWADFAVERLLKELSVQAYADGFQYELSTGYQDVVIRNYIALMRTMKAYNKPIPAKYYEVMESLQMLWVKLMRPNRCLPNINDGSNAPVKQCLAPYFDLFSENEHLRWVMTDTKEGKPLEEKSLVLPWAGMAAFRTGWGEDDTYLYFDAAPFGRAHQHEDKLQVLLHADRKFVLMEGNNYAYDTSEMRKYVLSTRTHNTVRVDGMCQNRRKTYEWHEEDIQKHSGIVTNLTETIDAARGVYDEGYGEDQDKNVTHERAVYFVKKMDGCKPFGMVVDRLTAKEGEHDYEVLWHLDEEKLIADGMQLQAGTLHVLVPDAPMETAGLSISRGVQFPEWQGWTANTALQKDFRPVYAAQYWLHGKDLRWVTVLYPDGNEACPIAGVEAGLDVKDTKITLRMADGSTVELDEAALW